MAEQGERQTATDNQGRVYEWIGGQWVPQGDKIGRVQAAMIGAGSTFNNMLDTVGLGDDGTGQAAIEQLREEQPFSVGIGESLPFAAAAR